MQAASTEPNNSPEEHYKRPITWHVAYGSYQSQNGGLHEYVIYPEMIDQFTDVGLRSMGK